LAYNDLVTQFLNAKANGDTATVASLQQQASSNSTVNTQASASADMQTVRENFLNAKANGTSTAGMSEAYQTAQSAYNNAGQPVVPPVQKTQAPAFDMNNFMNNYMNYMKGSFDSAKVGETALANNKMQQDLIAQEAEKRQGEKNYTDTLNTINNETYNASENAKVRGMERGINYSAQQAGVEAGIASRNITNKQQAQEVRDLRLGTIRDKINAIKSGNLAEIQAIEANYNAKLQESMGNAYMKGTERAWGVEDRNLGFEHDYNMADLNQSYTKENMAIGQGYDLDKIKANQENTLTNMGIQQKYDLEKIDVNNTNDVAKLDKMFEQDLAKMEIDQTYKKELQNMDYTFKKEFLKLETNEKKNLMAFDTEQQKVIMALDQKYKMSIIGAQNAGDMAQLQAKYKMESSSAMRDIMSSIIMNDPNFTAYPSTAEQGKMMTDLLGVVGGNITVDQFVNQNYKNLPSSKKEETKARVANAISLKSKLWADYEKQTGHIKTK